MRLTVAGLAVTALLLAMPVAHAQKSASKDAQKDAQKESQKSQQKDGGTDGQGKNLLEPLLGTMVIGNPFPMLPDCADTRTPDGRDVTAFCVELRGDGMMRQVGVPRDKRPVFMDGVSALAIVDGNALVGLIVPTDGVRNEKSALSSLTAAYGKPFRQEGEPIADKSRKTVEAVHAGWMQRPLTIELYAMPDDPNAGSIELLLPQARKLMVEREASVDQQLNPQAASAPAAKGGKQASKADAKKDTGTDTGKKAGKDAAAGGKSGSW